jgi:hypothetical protein
MLRFTPAFLALLAFTQTAILADELVPAGHSTVHVVFVTTYAQPTMAFNAERRGESQPQMVHVGDVVVPVESVRPIRICIDGDFVGHAMVGAWNIKPVFVLPEGKHKMTFAIDGFDPVVAEIKVLGTKSTQHLIVKLPTEEQKSDRSSTSSDPSTAQPTDN